MMVITIGYPGDSQAVKIANRFFQSLSVKLGGRPGDIRGYQFYGIFEQYAGWPTIMETHYRPACGVRRIHIDITNQQRG